MSDQQSTSGGSGSFLELDIDMRSEGFTAPERELMLAWYRDNHESGDSDLSKFPEFTIEHDGGGFKGYRRHIATIDRQIDGMALPQAAHLLMFLYAYILLGYEKGIVYIAINARRLGASRGEVLDVVRAATPAAGPFGLNAAAELLDDYLREWPEDGEEPGLEWPQGWGPEPEALRSGIDRTVDELLPGELEMLEDWYGKVYGEVPSHVGRLARLHPVGLKTQRLRFERAGGETLPIQMVPLCMLGYAAWRGKAKPMLRAAQLARSLGVGRTHVIGILFWAGIYGDDAILEPAFDVLGELIDEW
ncbi:MAG TPA: hypothetical protein VHA76_13510 [Solirubrobacterales bacterium]|nr:hypothetical protein [Solirubrobacterales bacterium]